MPCLIALFALFVPRITLALVFLFSDYLHRAYETAIWPVLGFLFMPLSTLAYAFAVNSNGTVTGLYLVVVVVAVLMDLGCVGGGARCGRRKDR